MEKKVSVITPCYNGERFIGRFLDSILNQSYENIELIIIDDGSEDNTKKIINEYAEKYKNKGYSLKYIYQLNSGQASAINRGLKEFTGEYLTWPDSDDFLHVDSIKRKVEFLEKNKEYGLVRTSSWIYEEKDLSKPIGYLGKEINPPEDIFEGLITESIGCTPGRYMVRTSCFLDVNQERKIYQSRAGQNWQMLLPISYKYKCGYIDDELFSYVLRADSHSHIDENVNEQISLNKINAHEDLLINVIDSIFKNDDKKRDEYNKLIKEKYTRKKFYVYSNYNNKKLLKYQYKVLKKEYNLTLNDKITYLRGNLKFLNNTIKSLKKIKKIINEK